MYLLLVLAVLADSTPYDVGFTAGFNWPVITVNFNIAWLAVLLLLMIVWHALTGGRRSH